VREWQVAPGVVTQPPLVLLQHTPAAISESGGRRIMVSSEVTIRRRRGGGTAPDGAPLATLRHAYRRVPEARPRGRRREYERSYTSPAHTWNARRENRYPGSVENRPDVEGMPVFGGSFTADRRRLAARRRSISFQHRPPGETLFSCQRSAKTRATMKLNGSASSS